MQLIVLGMHRSGTSVLARLLNLMGAYFGPEGASTGANSENPKGFWERRDVRNVNDTVLHSVDCDWNRVANFDVKALPPETIATFNQTVSRLVLDMDAHRPWFLKEPRLCLLFDLWRRRLEAPICIHIFRNPVEVASSLQKRNGIPIEVGLLLWERYVRSALRASAGLPQVVVSHRRLIEDPAAATQLREELEAHGVQGLRAPSRRELSAFVNDQFYREREGREDLQTYTQAPQLEIFRNLLETGTAPEETEDQYSAQKELLAKFEAGLPPIKMGARGGATQSMEVLRSQLALQEQESRFAKELCAKYESDLKRHDEWRIDIERERSDARSVIARLEFALADRDARLAVERTDVAALREAIGHTRAQVAQRDERVLAAESEADSLRTRLAASLVELDSARQDAAAVLAQLSAVSESATDAQIDAEARIAGMELAIAAAIESDIVAQARISDLEAMLAAAGDDAASLRTRLQAHEDDAAFVARTLRNENTTLHGQVQMLAAQVASLRSSLLEAERSAEADRAARMGAEESLADSRHEIVSLTRLMMDKEHAVAGLHGELTAARATHGELEARLQDSQRAYVSLKLQGTSALDYLAHRVQGMERTLSWRIGVPFRRLRAVFARAVVVDPLHWQVALVRDSEFFDEAWYLAGNPDVAGSGAGAAEHYIQFGASEGRNPGPDFDSHAYLHLNPDVLAAGTNPLVHFLTHGQAEGRPSR